MIPDVLVLGTGIAGLTTAIACREAGLSVLVLTKTDEIEECNTNYAQGGIIASAPDDQSSLLEKDILEAGCSVNFREMVGRFSREAPQTVQDFLAGHIGVEFSRDENGDWDYTEEAAHSRRRILHYEDHTGDAIEGGLVAYARKIGVTIRTACTAIDLITTEHHSTDCQERYRDPEVLGVYALDNASGAVETLFARAVVLATGGLGNIFQFTTNPSSASGDGIAMAARAGADIINAEFVQFHPTALFHKDIKRFLISESLRGEGARLLDPSGRPFMERYTAQAELAPRDVVTRAIYEEMGRQGCEYVLLDIANNYRGSEPLEKRFSRIYETCKKGGIDITRQAIPVVPAAHYFCGGIRVGEHGQTSIKRLFAVGEVACTGLHGANRLASTSMLEGLYGGLTTSAFLASRTASAGAPDNSSPFLELESSFSKRCSYIPDWKIPAGAETFEPTLIYQDWKYIKLTMWNHAGIVRTRKGLARAQADLNYHAHRITSFYREAVPTRDIVELRNAVETARIIVSHAIHREYSVGCHYRAD